MTSHGVENLSNLSIFQLTVRYFYSVFPTAPGWIAIVGSERGIKRLVLPKASATDAVREVLRRQEQATNNDLMYLGLGYRLRDYFSGKPVDFTRETLDIAGAPSFRTAVWEIVKGIPYGQTRTYAWVAGQAGNPEATRAVGQAMAANPVPIIIPCHRVVAAHGPGGYAGGLDLKRKLLEIEKLPARGSVPLRQRNIRPQQPQFLLQTAVA